MKPSILDEVFSVIEDRKDIPEEGSYVASLFDKGEDSIIEKVGEEAVELIIAAKNSDKPEIISEAADLIFHIMVLICEKGVTMEDIYTELRSRRP